MDTPVAYLVRAGSPDTSFPLLSDPSLSQSGIEQAEAVREFFFASGIGPIQAVTSTSIMQFAQLISEGFMPSKELPTVIVCDETADPMMSMVYPGGIIAVYNDMGTLRYEPKLREVPAEEHN